MTGWATREHGSHVRYVQGPNEYDARGIGCRCDLCRAANSAYEKARAQRVEPSYVPAGPARAHLVWLSEQGIGIKSIAKVAGVSHGALSKLVHGDYGRRTPPSRRIRPQTAERILALTPSRFAGTGTREPAGPILALVDRLIAAGVPKVRIAERLGQTGPALQLGRQLIQRRNASIIREMVAELDAGTLVTIKRHRNGDRHIAPPAQQEVPRTRQDLDDYDDLVLSLAKIVERRRDENEWRRVAACTGRPNWLFFPGRGDTDTLERAKKICRSCIVRTQCLEANLLEREGVFGGLSARERRRLPRPKELAS